MPSWVDKIVRKQTGTSIDLERLLKKYTPPKEFPDPESDFRKFDSLFPEFREVEKDQNPFRTRPPIDQPSFSPYGEPQPPPEPIEQPFTGANPFPKRPPPEPIEQPPPEPIEQPPDFKRFLFPEDVRDLMEPPMSIVSDRVTVPTPTPFRQEPVGELTPTSIVSDRVTAPQPLDFEEAKRSPEEEELRLEAIGKGETHYWVESERTWKLVEPTQEDILTRMPFSRQFEKLGKVTPFRQVGEVSKEYQNWLQTPIGQRVTLVVGLASIGLGLWQGSAPLRAKVSFNRLPERQVLISTAKEAKIPRSSPEFKNAEDALRSAFNLHRGGAPEAAQEIMSRFYYASGRTMPKPPTAPTTPFGGIVPKATQTFAMAQGGRQVQPWKVTVRQNIIVGGRKTPEPVDRVFTVQATTEAQAMKAVQQAGHKGEIISATPTTAPEGVTTPTTEPVVAPEVTPLGRVTGVEARGTLKTLREMLVDKKINELYPELGLLQSKWGNAVDRMGDIQERGGSGARYATIRDKTEVELLDLQYKIAREHPELSYLEPQPPVTPEVTPQSPHPLSKLEPWEYESTISRRELFTPEFNKSINEAYLEAGKRQGRVMRPAKVTTVREALSSDVLAQFPMELHDVEIWFASKLNDKHFTGFAIGMKDGERIIVMHPEQAENAYVRGIIHELKHLTDEIKGKVVLPTGEGEYTELIKVPAERRARSAEDTILRRISEQRRTQPPVTPVVAPEVKEKLPQFVKDFTPQQRETYLGEFNRLRGQGVDRNSAIRFAREVARGVIPPVTPEVTPERVQTVEEFKAKIREVAPNLTEEEVEALGSLIEGTASYLGITPDAYIQSRIKALVAGGPVEIDALLKSTSNHLGVDEGILSKSAQTPWGKATLKAIEIRQEIDVLLVGNEPATNRVKQPLRDDIKTRGIEAIYDYLVRTKVIGGATKPVVSVASSPINCRPSEVCALFCYAYTGSAGAYPAVMIKSELIDVGVREDPYRVADIVSEEFKATNLFEEEKALRFFDRGEGNELWLKTIDGINAQGLRGHVFSKRPTFLEMVDSKNVRLLSIDSTNADLARGNNLPIALNYANEADLALLGEFRSRVQVILPVQGVATPADIAALPAWSKPNQCPVDTKRKVIGKVYNSNPIGKSWNCPNCDVGVGIGCYHGQVTDLSKFGQAPNKLRKQRNEDITAAVTFGEDGRAVIRAFENTTVADLAHELGHIFRRDLIPTDLATAEAFAGVKDGIWTRRAEEKFANGFERYLRDGKAPTPKLKAVFARFREWLTAIYRNIKGSSIDIKLTPEIRGVFDRMLGGVKVTPTEVAPRVTAKGIRITPKAKISPTGAETKLPPKIDDPLPVSPSSKAEAKQNVDSQLYETITDSPLDVSSTTYRKSGNFDDFIKNMPTFTKLTPSDIQGLQQMFKDFPGIEPSTVGLKLLKSGKLTPAMRKSGFYVNQEFVNYDKFVDVSLPSGTAQDPTRMMQNIQGGFGVGPITKYITYPTRSTQLASLNYSDSEKYLYRGIIEKHGMTGNKEFRRLAGDVIEHIGRETDIKKIMAKPEVKALLDKVSRENGERIVSYALDSRKTFDKLIHAQNKARGKRNQEEIRYLENYRPWIRETNVWSKLMGQGQKPGTVMQSHVLPDYIKPNAPFNPRAMARKGGLENYLKERDLQKLVFDYIDTATKDIFNTNIIHNAKIHAATLRSMGYSNSATLIENWAAEAYAGIPPSITKAIRTVAPAGVVRSGLWLRRRLTSAVFPLNFTWNAFVQTSSAALTMMRYGVTNSLRGLDYLFDSHVKQAVRTNAYSMIIKQRQAGKVAYQDVGSSTAKVMELEASKIETVEHYLNFITNIFEEKLTGVSVRAAYHDGLKKGYKGRALWEYASEGGAKTQSMYNLEDLPGILRAKEVGALVPFQTFAFEVFNSARELNIIGVRRVIGKAGAYESTSAKSPEGKATISNRLKMLARWIIAMVIINMYVDKVINRKPWSTSSFIPFFAVLTGGVNAGNHWNMLLPLKYSADLKGGIDNVIKYGNFKKLRRWALTYHMLAGVQLNRTIEGIEAVAKGEVTSASGERMFKVGKDEAWKAILMGVYTTEGGREYIDRLQEKEGGVVKELTGIPLEQRGWGDKWRKDFDEYNKIPSDPDEERAAILAGIVKYKRSEYRKVYPTVDAKLFIAGVVSSIMSVDMNKKRSKASHNAVLRLVKKHKIEPTEIPEVREWQKAEEKRKERGEVDKNITPTEKLIIELLGVNQVTPPDAQPPSKPGKKDWGFTGANPFPKRPSP